MKSVSARELRQSLGKVLRALEKGGGPIFVERAHQPSAVLISLRDFNERFVDRTADDQRRAIVQRIRSLRFPAPRGATTLSILRKLRDGR